MNARSVGADAVERRFLVQEHREIVTGLARIEETASNVGRLAGVDLAWHLGSLTRWLESVFEPHSSWEEAWLYPRLEQLTGNQWLSRVLSFDHEQIRERIEGLKAQRDRLADGTSPTALRPALLAALFGLDAVVRAHLEREERFLMPLLQETENEERLG